MSALAVPVIPDSCGTVYFTVYGFGPPPHKRRNSHLWGRGDRVRSFTPSTKPSQVWLTSADRTSALCSGGYQLNTFGAYNQQYPIYDPRSVRENRDRFSREAVKSLDLANSFYCPTGRQPCRGWLLMRRNDYNSIDKYSTALQLNIGDTTSTNNVKALKNVCIVQAQCVTRGLEANKDALYLVEVTDARGTLHNQWFQAPITNAYNIRAPAYPQVFHPSSMNGAVVWTWSTMLQDMWTQVGGFLGTWPGLPNAPVGTPEGFWFTGVPIWTALCDVLDQLGMTIACDLTKGFPNSYTIVYSGNADTAFSALQRKYVGNLKEDLEWIDVGVGRVPKTVTVLFRRRNSVYGTEETVTYQNDATAQQWDMNPLYKVVVNAPLLFTKAVSGHTLWSDFTVRYDDSSNPLDADIATAKAIANDLVTRYFGRIYSQTSGFMSQTYIGALPFTTGAQVDGVCYYQDYHDSKRQGWLTHIVRGTEPIWPDIYKEVV